MKEVGGYANVTVINARCDRCGARITSPAPPIRLVATYDAQHLHDDSLDLCSPCSAAFVEWMENE